MVECGKCDKEIRGRQKKVSCATCRQEFHTKCQGISDLKHEVLLEGNDDIMWFCKACRVTTINMVHKLSEFEIRIAEMETREEVLKKELTVMHNLTKTLCEQNKAIEEELKSFKDRETQTSQQSNVLKEQLADLKARFYNQSEEKKEESAKNRTRIDDIEQDSKMNNLRFAGIPEEEGEDLQSNVLVITKEKLNLQSISESDIDLCYRLGRSVEGKNRDILVRFQSRDKRNLIYQCRRNMPREEPPVYINEDLTLIRSKLFYDARCKKKSGRVSAVWTQEGTTVIKINESSEPLPIKTHSDLRDALYGNLNTNLSDYEDSDANEETVSDYN